MKCKHSGQLSLGYFDLDCATSLWVEGQDFKHLVLIAAVFSSHQLSLTIIISSYFARRVSLEEHFMTYCLGMLTFADDSTT